MLSSEHGAKGGNVGLRARRVEATVGDDARSDGLSPVGRVPCDGLARCNVGNGPEGKDRARDILSRPPLAHFFCAPFPPQRSQTKRTLNNAF